jgi:CubicO group peptidase (beta-lactamase class C family)
VPWWSFTKLVIATAALKLVEQGSLDLDRSPSGKPVTLRHLLQHEAGLPDYGWLESYHSAVASGDEPWPASEIIARTIEAHPPWAPGTRWAYSNIGYYYVGELITSAAGKSLGEALDVLALEPTGVRTARLAASKTDLETVEMGSGKGYDPRWVLHGLLVGPIAEAAAFLHGLLSGTVLNESTLAAMLKIRLLPQFRDELWQQPAYGLGIMGAWDGVATPCGHSGEGPGSAIAVYGNVLDSEVSVAACWESPGTSRTAEKVVLEMLEKD